MAKTSRITLGVATLALALLSTQTACAQTPVVDAADLAYAIRIASRVYDQYKQIVQQRLELARMRERLGNMDAFKTVPIPGSVHDVARYADARDLLSALNAGDARGDLYRESVRAVGALPAVVDRLSPEARATLRRQYGDTESADSILQRAIHATAQVRQFSANEMARALAALEDDTLVDSTKMHDITANLDKLAAGELLARRQDAAENLELSHVLEILLMQGKVKRDADALAQRMRIETLTTPPPSRARLTSDLTSGWRQP